MTWNYRIVRYKNGCYGLHGVYYDDAGKVQSMDEEAMVESDSEEGKAGIIASLTTALEDAMNRPILDEPDWPVV